MARFFAAGHADAALFWTQSGHALLVDAGRGNAWLLGDDLARRRLIPHLRAAGIRWLDAFVLTHPHPDHIGNVGLLFGRVRVRRAMTNADGRALLTGLRGQIPGRVPRVRLWARGDGLRLGALRVEVLAPGRDDPSTPPPGQSRSTWENNRSLVLRVRFGAVRLLLMGDVMRAGEKALLRRVRDLRADVLKVGHHGLGSTSDALLRAVRPRYAVISCGQTRGGRRSLPDRSLLARLRRQGVTALRTDRDGDVVVVSDGTRLQVRTEAQHRLTRVRLPR